MRRDRLSYSTLGGIGLILTAVFASASRAGDWQTVPVHQNDSVSSLFAANRVNQGVLAQMVSNGAIDKRLRAVRPGDTLELRVDGRLLSSVRVHDRAGGVTTFKRGTSSAWTQRRSTLTHEARVALLVRRMETDRTQSTAAIAAQTVTDPAPVQVDKLTPKLAKFSAMALRTLESHTTQIAKPAKARLSSLDQLVAPTALQPRAAPVKSTDYAAVARLVRAAEERVWSGATATPSRRTTKLAALVMRAERGFHPGQKNRRARHRVRTTAKARSWSPGDPRVAALLTGARQHLGAPYLWGGTTPRGFDCSGFVSYHMKKVGIRVPRTAAQQFRHTKMAAVSRADLRPGDLVFFWDRKRRNHIGHVGIYLGDNKFIHAVGDNIPVTITRLDKRSYRRRFVRGGRVISS